MARQPEVLLLLLEGQGHGQQHCPMRCSPSVLVVSFPAHQQPCIQVAGEYEFLVLPLLSITFQNITCLISDRLIIRVACLVQACYEGVGIAADAQEALLWLGRATKTLLAEELSLESISNVSTGGLLARRNQLQYQRRQGLAHHRKPSFQTACSMPEEQVLAKAALLLGFLHLDGEATKFDAAEALKWFKVALLNDCPEAERIIGSLFNTGQYG